MARSTSNKGVASSSVTITGRGLLVVACVALAGVAGYAAAYLLAVT